MMRNANCFAILFPINIQPRCANEASQSNPLLVVLPNLSIKMSFSTYKYAQKILTQWHQKVITSGVKQHLSAQHCIPLIIPPFLGHHFYNQSFWVHTRNILSLVQCTNSGHSPSSVFLPYKVGLHSLSRFDHVFGQSRVILEIFLKSD